MTSIKLRCTGEKARVESLPCEISFTGDCAVRDYFVEEDPSNPLDNECGINGSQVDIIDQTQYLKPFPTAYFRGRRMSKTTINLSNNGAIDNGNTDEKTSSKTFDNRNNNNNSSSSNNSSSTSDCNKNDASSSNSNENNENCSKKSNSDSDSNVTKKNNTDTEDATDSKCDNTDTNNSKEKEKDGQKLQMQGYFLEQSFDSNNKKVWITSKNFDKINVWSLLAKDRTKYQSGIHDWFHLSKAIHDPVETTTSDGK